MENDEQRTTTPRTPEPPLPDNRTVKYPEQHPTGVVVSLEDVTMNFGRTKALKGVSFTIEKGGVVGFLGRNGAGKTTTLRIITSFFQPSSGRVEVMGLNPVEYRFELTGKIGYLPEKPPLYAEMSVRSYLEFCWCLKGRNRSGYRARLDEITADFGIETVLDRQCGHLSKGYRQRVGLAQAFIHEPDLVLLDEPTAGLDPEQTRATRRIITSQSEKTTILLSSHLLSEVRNMCKRIIIIEEGRIIAHDTPSELARGVGGRKRMRAVLRMPKNKSIEKLVETLPAVRLLGARVLDDKDENARIVGIELECQDNQSFGPERISAHLVKNGAGIRSYEEIEWSLEEVFLHYVRNKGQVGQGEDPAE